jgi:putative exporter of polyketide antibiotics
MIGVIISLGGETSDYVDPVTFTFATVSILIAIIGIALIFKMPNEEADTKKTPQT